MTLWFLFSALTAVVSFVLLFSLWSRESDSFLPRVRLCVVVFSVPALALSLYLNRGSPHLPSLPSASRLDLALQNRDWPAMLAKVEAHLAKHPRDLRGWLVLIPLYRQQNNLEKAQSAYEAALALSPQNSDLWFEYGEMLLQSQGGTLTPKAREIIEKSLSLVSGRTPEPPWKLQAQRYLALPKLPHVQATPQIEAMVHRLEARLKDHPDDLEGWLKLIRAWVVLGDRDKGTDALKKALGHFISRPEDRQKLETAAREWALMEKAP